MLNRAPVLVAEDEAFIALDLAFAIQDAGGRVVGPASTVVQALELLSTRAVAGAILDVNLLDGDVLPVVERLVDQDIPLILQTGMGLTSNLAARFPQLTVHIKPVLSERLVADLGKMLNRSGA